MNNLLAALKASTATTPPTKPTADGYSAALAIIRSSTTPKGKVDIDQLSSQIARRPDSGQSVRRFVESRLTPVETGQLARNLDVQQAVTARDVTTALPLSIATKLNFGRGDIDQLFAQIARRPDGGQSERRFLESRLTPVEAGQLARLRDIAVAGASSSGATKTTNRPVTASQTRLTPVQQGELAREIIASRTSGSRTPADAPTSKPSDTFAGGELLNQRRALGFFGRIGDAFSDGFDTVVNFVGDKVVDPIIEGGEVVIDVIEDNGGAIVGGTVGVVAGGLLPPGIGLIPPLVDAIGGAVINPAVQNNPIIDNINDAINDIIPTPVQSGAQIISKAFEGAANTLGGVVNGKYGDEFLSIAGTGTEWGEHLFELSGKPGAKAGFVEGFAKGVGEGLVDLGKTVGGLIQAGLDIAPLGRLGDVIRDWDRTGALPPAVNEILPSAMRGRQTVIDTFNSAKNLADYVKTRTDDPQLLRDDVRNYMKDNWNKLKSDWQKAHDKGPRAEGEFFGKIAGKVALEVALEFVPGKAVLSALKAAEKVSDFAQKVKRLPDGQTVKTTDLPAYEKTLDDLNAKADQVKITGEVSDAELTQLQDTWTELNEINPQSFGFGPEAERISGKIAETKADIEQAVDAVYRLSTPNRKRQRAQKEAEWKAQLTERAETIKYRPGYDPDFTDVQNKLRNIPKNQVLRLNPNQSVTFDDLHRVTQDRGHEYAIFEVILANGGKQQYIGRGNADTIEFRDSTIENLKNQDAKLVAHSHVGTTTADLEPSDDDIALLNEFGGDSSYITNGSGKTAQFRADGTYTKVRQYNDKDSFNTAANNAEPDTIYEYRKSGNLTYTYQTNDDGLIDTVQFAVTTNNPGSRNSLQTTIGGEGLEGDVGFHLHAVALGGETNRLTVVPGDGLLNSTNNSYDTFGNWETNLLNRKKNNPNLQLEARIQVKYDESLGSNDPLFNRPTEFIASYREQNSAGVWGPWQSTTFVNEAPDPIA
jgi:hypothetical protein